MHNCPVCKTTYLPGLERSAEHQGAWEGDARPKSSVYVVKDESLRSSHLLEERCEYVTYSNILSADFHVDSIVEMRRVASQVRVFPLVTQFDGETSPHLEAVIDRLNARGFQVEVRKVDYEFQKGGNQMLWVR